MQHDRVDISALAASCGIVQISRLSEEQDENLFVIANSFYHPSRGQPPAFAIFSNIADEDTGSHRLHALILHLKFGPVMVSTKALNPKTGNVIKVWVWHIDHEPFKKWYKEKKILKLKD